MNQRLHSQHLLNPVSRILATFVHALHCRIWQGERGHSNGFLKMLYYDEKVFIHKTHTSTHIYWSFKKKDGSHELVYRPFFNMAKFVKFIVPNSMSSFTSPPS